MANTSESLPYKISISYQLPAGARIDVVIDSVSADHAEGTATLTEPTPGGRTTVATTHARVSFANTRYQHVHVNHIELYDPPAAFLAHLPHGHRVWDDEADSWLTVAPKPVLQVTDDFKAALAAEVDAQHEGFRRRVLEGTSDVVETLYGPGMRDRAAWHVAYGWVIEECGIETEWELRALSPEALDEILRTGEAGKRARGERIAAVEALAWAAKD